MKNVTKLIISAALLAPVFVIGSLGAIARENGTSPAQARPGEAQITVAQEEDIEEGNEGTNKKAKLQERLEQRKAARNLRLTFAEQQRLQSVCKPSQGKLQALRGRINGIETSRTERYSNLINRLERASTKLQEKAIDTAQLDEQINEMKIKIAAFEAALAEYKLVVSDLGDMDCVEAPVSFKASLEAARESLQQVKQASDDIKTYLQTVLKPTLLQIRTQLNGEPETTEESTNNTEETPEAPVAPPAEEIIVDEEGQ